MEIMEILKQARAKKGYTQEKMARMLDVSLRSYQNIEYEIHEPRISLGLRLCKILDIDPFEVFLSEDQIESKD